MYVVPRNTSVVVRRSPAARPGKGTAQRYVLGVLPTDGKSAGGFGVMKGGPSVNGGPPGAGAGGNPQFNMNGHRNLVLNAQKTFVSKPSASPQTPNNDPTNNNNEPKEEVNDDSEEARIQAMFQQTTDQWGALQERLAE